MSTSLSVIIPGFNTPNKWWGRCIRSVLFALPDSGEIICVDDGSRVRPEVDVTDARIKWIYLEKNVGQSDARNAALEQAKGEFVTFVDSDDEVVPSIYREIFLQKDECSDVVVFGVRVCWTNEQLMKEDVPRRRDCSRLDIENLQLLFDGCLFEYPVNKVFRREFLERNRIAFDSGICPGEDTIFNLKCLLAGARYQCLPMVGYIYYRYFTSSLARYQARFEQSLRIRNAMWKDVKRGIRSANGLDVKLGELSEDEIFAWTIENAWRFDSPLTLKERLERYGGVKIFLKMFLKQFARRFFYARPIRRWKIKKMFPHVKEVE